MLDFQKKVEILRRYESLCYTICVSLLHDEAEACKAAEQALLLLFADQAFLQETDEGKPRYVLRLCTKESLNRKMRNGLKQSASF
ncbi:hypothetical protein [Paenibacillus harenae]|uniref:hypothetical protein n=1 Tax=Paenibacillus harenae TaxID=306543 RepID=UPI00042825D1|nr:hypothetical protein [Paenibacillus harenae]